MFFFSSRRRHTRWPRDWSSDVCSSDLKFTGSGGTLEETVTKNNLEAAEEIVRQLRLRDVGGIIVIDFIDMVLESNRDLVLRRLVECLRSEEHTSELQSRGHLVCRLLLEKKTNSRTRTRAETGAGA